MYNRLDRIIFTCIALLICLPGCGGRKKMSKRELEKERLSQQRPFKNKKIERLTFEEAQAVYGYYKRHEQKPQTAQTIERMIMLSTDHDFVEPLLHELADLTFELGKNQKAEEYYAQYALLYPGGSSIDYMKAQQIEAAYKQVSTPERDQSKTKEIIQLADNFLSSFPASNSFTKRIQQIRQNCYFSLMESELNQIVFYLQRFEIFNNTKSLDAAWQRLMHLNQEILPHITDQRIKAAQQAITDAANAPEADRTQTAIERLIAPLQAIIRKKFKESLPAHRHPWRNRF